MLTSVPAMMLILVLVFLFYTNTTANRNCDADINRNTSICTSMDVSDTKAIQLYSQQNTTIIVNTILKPYKHEYQY